MADGSTGAQQGSDNATPAQASHGRTEPTATSPVPAGPPVRVLLSVSIESDPPQPKCRRMLPATPRYDAALPGRVAVARGGMADCAGTARVCARTSFGDMGAARSAPVDRWSAPSNPS